MSNCLLFALRMMLQRGGYVVMRKSKYGWWLHFSWSPDLKQFWEWTTRGPKRRRYCPPILFKGRIRKWRNRSTSA